MTNAPDGFDTGIHKKALDQRLAKRTEREKCGPRSRRPLQTSCNDEAVHPTLPLTSTHSSDCAAPGAVPPIRRYVSTLLTERPRAGLEGRLLTCVAKERILQAGIPCIPKAMRKFPIRCFRFKRSMDPRGQHVRIPVLTPLAKGSMHPPGRQCGESRLFTPTSGVHTSQARHRYSRLLTTRSENFGDCFVPKSRSCKKPLGWLLRSVALETERRVKTRTPRYPFVDTGVERAFKRISNLEEIANRHVASKKKLIPNVGFAHVAPRQSSFEQHFSSRPIQCNEGRRFV